MLLLVLPIVVGYCAYQPVQQMGELRGRPFEVYKFIQSTEVVINPGSGPRRTEQLVVGFWSDTSDLDQMLADSRQASPPFLDIAQSLGLRHVVLQPSHPVVVRRFPFGIRSYHVRYARDSMGGYWVEEFRSGDADRAAAGVPLAFDDSLGQALIRHLCERDSTGVGLIAPSERETFSNWTEVANRLAPSVAACGGQIELMSVAAGKPTEGTARRLAYRVYAVADTSLLALWLRDEASGRYVNTVQTFSR